MIERFLAIALCAIATGICPQAGRGCPPVVRVGLNWQSQQRTSVAVSAPGGFVLSQNGQETRGQAQAWTFYAPAAAPLPSADAANVHDGQVFAVTPDGAGAWLCLPVRITPDANAVTLLSAGADAQAMRAYEGVIEITRDVAGRLTMVNVVDLEAYTRGTLWYEMGAKFPAEALRAQAVAIRSVALANRGKRQAEGFDFGALHDVQGYGGVARRAACDAAVAATRGQVLMFDGKPADASYHTVCGGYTESARDVWGSDAPYLRGGPDAPEDGNAPADGYRVDDERLRAYLSAAPTVYCAQPDLVDVAKWLRWERVIPREQIEKTLANRAALANMRLPVDAASIGQVVDLRPVTRGVSGRIMRLEIVGVNGTVTVDKELTIRRALGGPASSSWLPSSAFWVERQCDDAGQATAFLLHGAGWGHGVGMCQIGAAGMARAGRTYREILAKYYPGTEIQTLY